MISDMSSIARQELASVAEQAARNAIRDTVLYDAVASWWLRSTIDAGFSAACGVLAENGRELSDGDVERLAEQAMVSAKEIFDVRHRIIDSLDMDVEYSADAAVSRVLAEFLSGPGCC